MKVFAVLAACVFATFSSAAQQGTQVFTIIDRLNQINTLTKNLTVQIDNWNLTSDQTENVISSAPVLAASTNLVSYIDDSNDEIKKFNMLIETDTLRLEPPVNTLTHTVGKAIDAIIKKKGIIFLDPSLLVIVQGLIYNEKYAAGNLSDTIVGKVPEDLRSVARLLAAGISENLQYGVNAYKCETCDAETGKPNTCKANSTSDPCNDSAGSTVSSLSAIATLCLVAVVATFIVL